MHGDAAPDELAVAEALVQANLPFREAHETVGRIVKHCLEKDLDLRSLSREDLRAFHPAFDASAAELLSLERALQERAHVGGTARERVIEALEAAEARIAREARELDERKEG